MTSSPHYVYANAIAPTNENAIAIQQLILQDLVEAKAPNPQSIADPSNPEKVDKQRWKLENFPGRYSGFMVDGKLVAYMKVGNWHREDMVKFAGPIGATWLRLSKLLRIRVWRHRRGIFGLVVSDQVAESKRLELIEQLLQKACSSGIRLRREVFLISRNGDAVTLVATVQQSFVPVGKVGVAPDVPGVPQRCYKRTFMS